MDGPDHAASTEPGDFANLVQAIRRVENCLGNGAKTPTEAEKRISKVVTKRIVAKREIQKGEVLTEENICVKRNDVGELASCWDDVVGKIATCDYKLDEGILR